MCILLVVFLELFDGYFAGIRYLLVVGEQYLLSDNLGDEEAGRLVGECVFLKEWRRGGSSSCMRRMR